MMGTETTSIKYIVCVYCLYRTIGILKEDSSTQCPRCARSDGLCQAEETLTVPVEDDIAYVPGKCPECRMCGDHKMDCSRRNT